MSTHVAFIVWPKHVIKVDMHCSRPGMPLCFILNVGSFNLTLSSSGHRNSVSGHSSSGLGLCGQCLLANCYGFRRKHARDKAKLQALISELDLYVQSVDSSSHPAMEVGYYYAGMLIRWEFQ